MRLKEGIANGHAHKMYILGDVLMGLALGQYIKATRKTAKMSAQALSQKAGISKSYLDYIESGTREPKPDVLAKIAVSLNAPLDALIDKQKQDQLKAAVNKLRAGNAAAGDKGLLALARNADDGMTVDEKALAITQAAFQGANDDARFVEFIGNPDLRAILKVGAKLSDGDVAKIRKVMESLYPEEFI
jgi:transcriptional regulator with XRE-family HTH domain